MILISHRGNLNGKIPDRENSPSYILKALEKGYDVEIDVWFSDGKFWLGHDKPQYETDYKFLINEKFWCHAKNVDALFEMKKYVIHYFWHENDEFTLTSKNYIWTYPTRENKPGTISVLPETFNQSVEGCKGVCSDYIESYK
jgi:hypothetical protein